MARPISCSCQMMSLKIIPIKHFLEPITYVITLYFSNLNQQNSKNLTASAAVTKYLQKNHSSKIDSNKYTCV